MSDNYRVFSNWKRLLPVSKRQVRILCIALPIQVSLLFGVLAFTVTHLKRSMLGNSSASAVTASATRGPIQNIRFTVYDQGIYPRQLRAKPGVVAIVLEDRTRKHTRLLIEQETAGGVLPVGGMSFLVDQSRSRTEFKLDAGRYQVFDATNRENRAELLVEF